MITRYLVHDKILSSCFEKRGMFFRVCFNFEPGLRVDEEAKKASLVQTRHNADPPGLQKVSRGSRSDVAIQGPWVPGKHWAPVILLQQRPVRVLTVPGSKWVPLGISMGDPGDQTRGLLWYRKGRVEI